MATDERGETQSVGFERNTKMTRVATEKRKANKIRIEPGAGFLGLQGAAPTITVERGSGNVFADLGLPDAEELNTKLRLAVAINRQMEARQLTQARVANVLGIGPRRYPRSSTTSLKSFPWNV